MSEKTEFQESGNDVEFSLSGAISKGSRALCPVCRSALDGGRTVTICDGVLDILIQTNRLSGEVYARYLEFKIRPRVIICFRHFNIPPNLERLSKAKQVQCLKSELDDRRDWTVQTRSTSVTVQEKRRVSMLLVEEEEKDREMELYEANLLENFKRQEEERRAEEKRVQLAAKAEEERVQREEIAKKERRQLELSKKFVVEPIPIEQSSVLQRALHFGLSWKAEENPLGLEGRLRIANWDNEQLQIDQMFAMLTMYQEKVQHLQTHVATLEQTVVSGKQERDELRTQLVTATTTARFTVNTMNASHWRVFTSFTSKDEYMSCLGNFLLSDPSFRQSSNENTTLVDRGIWFLMYVYAGLTVRSIAALAGCSYSTVSKGIRRVTSILFGKEKDSIKFPTSEAEIKDWYLSQPESLRRDFPEMAFFAVDGTPLPTFKPTSNKANRVNFALKYHYCCKRYFILVDMTGRIVYLSKLFAGNSHDKTMFIKAECKAFMEMCYSNLPTPAWNFDWGTVTPAICGDKAYPTLDIPEKWGLVITKSGEKRGIAASLTRDVQFTMKIAPYRTEVERTFAKIKRFQLLSQGRLWIAKDVVKMNKVIRIVAVIVNWQIKNRSHTFRNAQ